MTEWVRLAGPSLALEIAGVKLVGVTAENGRKLVITLLFVLIIWLAARAAHHATHSTLQHNKRLEFWARQFIRIATTIVAVVGVVSIWFDDPGRATAALGLFTAGLAFALQRVVTAFSGYIVILRGATFNVGDRIKMGGVRGDVIAISFLQTTIMEMGQPPAAQQEDPGMWVQARQYSGRIVTVTNAKIFDEPVYNYTRDFPFLWEEIHLPIPYGGDWQKAEQILLEAAKRHAVKADGLAEEIIAELQRRYFMASPDLEPRVFVRLTDNWNELSLRFVASEHGVREMKDKMSREILGGMAEAGIQVASATFEIVGLPTLRLARASAASAESH
jgi:small-conductance mechanosensitive channel